jgi:murein DD-endopeptidase MepM/ murein hydrolase activator NlpD
MKRGDLTVIVARFADVPARKYLIPRRLVLASLVALIILLSSFVLSSLHYYHMWKKTAQHDQLMVEVDLLQRENETFRLSASQLNAKISALEVTSKKLTILSGLERDGLGGVGGPTDSRNPVMRLSSKDLLKHFTTLERKTVSVRTELSRLQEYYTTRAALLAATPAIVPVRGYPSGPFGYRDDPFTGNREFHPGIDISAPYGKEVVASADGLTVFAGRRFGYGNLVVLEHKFGISTRYGHLSRIVVKNGQKIKKGDPIGYVGSTGRATGPHLHYEVRLNEQPLNPVRFFRE